MVYQLSCWSVPCHGLDASHGLPARRAGPRFACRGRLHGWGARAVRRRKDAQGPGIVPPVRKSCYRVPAVANGGAGGCPHLRRADNTDLAETAPTVSRPFCGQGVRDGRFARRDHSRERVCERGGYRPASESAVMHKLRELLLLALGEQLRATMVAEDLPGQVTVPQRYRLRDQRPPISAAQECRVPSLASMMVSPRRAWNTACGGVNGT